MPQAKKPQSQSFPADDRAFGQALRTSPSKASLEKLISKGADPTILNRWLFYFLQRNGLSPEPVWHSVVGKTRKSLSALPSRLDRMADELAHVNEGRFTRPEGEFAKACFSEVSEYNGQVIRLKELPEALRLYAEYLRTLLPCLNRLELARRDKTSIDVAVLEWVKENTGHYLYEDVACVLSEAYHILRIKRTITGMQLKQSLRRHKGSKSFLESTSPEFTSLFLPRKKSS